MEEANRTEHNGCVIRIVQDDDPMNPREWDNLGTILHVSGEYELGDRRVTREDIREITKRKDVIWLPVYALIHSGVWVNTCGFSCPWDSGMCGIIYVEVEKAKQEYGESYSEETVKEVLKGEIETFNQYLTGDIYGFVVEKDGQHVDSGWGFFSEEGVKDATAHAKLAADWEMAEAHRAACQC